MTSQTGPTLLQETVLKQQHPCHFRIGNDIDDLISSVVKEELKKACLEIGNRKASGLVIIPNNALKEAII